MQLLKKRSFLLTLAFLIAPPFMKQGGSGYNLSASTSEGVKLEGSIDIILVDQKNKALLNIKGFTSESTVGDIKKIIEDEYGTKLERQVLSLGGAPLNSNQTFKAAGITNNATIGFSVIKKRLLPQRKEEIEKRSQTATRREPKRRPGKRVRPSGRLRPKRKTSGSKAVPVPVTAKKLLAATDKQEKRSTQQRVDLEVSESRAGSEVSESRASSEVSESRASSEVSESREEVSLRAPSEELSVHTQQNQAKKNQTLYWTLGIGMPLVLLALGGAYYYVQKKKEPLFDQEKEWDEYE